MQRARVERAGTSMPLYRGSKILFVVSLAEAFGQTVQGLSLNEPVEFLRASRWIYAMLCGSLRGMQPQARQSLFSKVLVGA